LPGESRDDGRRGRRLIRSEVLLDFRTRRLGLGSQSGCPFVVAAAADRDGQLDER
jgi:hypothetical protein